MKRTPLFAAHQKLGAKLIEFGGWEMPVQYTSISDEHLAVRSAAGLFDISHMGEVSVSGSGAEAFLNHVLTNDIRKIAPGQGQYTLMCKERGGVIDDLYAYHLTQGQFLLIINASRIDADVSWLEKQLAGFPDRSNVQLKNLSVTTAALAVQGPKVRAFMDQVFSSSSSSSNTPPTCLKKNQISAFKFHGQQLWVARTGYTGEDGFEVIAPADIVEALWDDLLATGKPHGLKPAGLGARDTLRTEVCYPLYGHELDETTTPIEAGLGFFVALEKGEFIGRSVLAGQKANGTAKKLVAFKMTGKSAPPRPGYPIWSSGPDGGAIGQVVSGTQSPSLGIGIGLGYVPPDFAKSETAIQIEIRGKLSPALVARKPIYQRASS